MRKQLIYSAAISIAARSRSMTRKSIVALDPRRVQMMRYEPECRGPFTPIRIPNPTDGPSSSGCFPLLVFRSRTGSFRSSRIDPFSRRIIVKFPNGFTSNRRDINDRLTQSEVPKYEVSRKIFNCSISGDGQYTFRSRINACGVADCRVVLRRVVLRPGSTTCRILASIYVARGIRPDTVPKSRAITAFVPPSMTP